jgi:hypothetical protein
MSRWGKDEDLLDVLGEALREAGSVEHGAAMARRVWAHRGIGRDREVAGLRFDSYLDPVSSVRGDGDVEQRMLSFATGTDHGLELALVGDGLLGQVLPPVAGEVTLTCGTGLSAVTTSDEVGCFDLPRPEGPFLLTFRSADGVVSFVTTWTRL